VLYRGLARALRGAFRRRTAATIPTTATIARNEIGSDVLLEVLDALWVVGMIELVVLDVVGANAAVDWVVIGVEEVVAVALEESENRSIPGPCE